MNEKPEKMSALARVLENMIVHGATEGIQNRIDILYAAAKLTDDEYAYLLSILPVD